MLATIAITGSIQLWDRRCDGNGGCDLPAPLSAKMAVSGEVSEPAGPGQLGLFRVPLADEGRAVDFQVFWVAPPDGTKPYLVAQIRLTEAGRLITECTQYASADQPGFFPVGMCSGFLPDAKGSRQVGVTFYRH
jgi:hypothetical protein